MKNQCKWITAAGVLLLFAGIGLSLCVGAKQLSIQQILHGIFQYQGTLEDQLVRDVRLPRIIAGACIGGFLASVGAMMQGVLRNPVTEPSIMGVTQGAVLAVAISTVTSSFFGSNFIAALIGASVSGLLVLLFTLQKASHQHISKILLAGTSLGMFFISLASIIALIGNRSNELAFWVAGGLRTIQWHQVAILVSVGSIFFVLCMLLTNKINILAMGDEVATGLGISSYQTKSKVIVYTIPICAVCVACAGNISFLGLFVPHVLRKLKCQDYRVLVPLSFIYGAVVLVFADILARLLLAPYELPVGVFTAIIGVPIFLWLVRKENR